MKTCGSALFAAILGVDVSNTVAPVATVTDWLILMQQGTASPVNLAQSLRKEQLVSAMADLVFLNMRHVGRMMYKVF